MVEHLKKLKHNRLVLSARRPNVKLAASAEFDCQHQLVSVIIICCFTFTPNIVVLSTLIGPVRTRNDVADNQGIVTKSTAILDDVTMKTMDTLMQIVEHGRSFTEFERSTRNNKKNLRCLKFSRTDDDFVSFSLLNRRYDKLTQMKTSTQ